MDKHVLHNILHRDSGSNSKTCPVCKGEMSMDDTKGMTAKANEILDRKQSMGMMYDEDEKTLKQFNETEKEKQEKVEKETDKEVSEDVAFRPLIDILSFAESGSEIPSVIKLIPIGKYKMVRYGEVDLNKEKIAEMIQHFNEGIRAGGKAAGLPIDIEHGTTSYKDAAAGWIKDIELKEDGAYGKVDWTTLGKKLLKERIYKFYSPEFHFKYVDPEHSFELNNVMTGGGLVNKPMIKDDLPAIVNAEKEENTNLTKEKNQHILYLELINSTQKIMKLSEILSKEKSARTSEEATFLSEHKDELTLAQARTEGLLPEAKTTLSEGQIVVDAKKLEALTVMAEAGKSASDKLAKADLKEQIKNAVFSEKGVRMAADQIDVAVNLAFSMSEENRTLYIKQLESLPEVKLMEESGTTEKTNTSTVAKDELEKAVKKFMEENKGIAYAEALKSVVAMNPEQLKEYQQNLPVAAQEK